MVTFVPAPPGRSVEFSRGVAHFIDFPTINSGAEPALYLPGLGAPAPSWTDLAELLRPRFNGQALDLPGLGRSKTYGDYSVRSHTDFVTNWIEHCGRGPVHLFGNSFGGLIAMRVAALRPELVRTLTLISPAIPCLTGSVQRRYFPLLTPRMSAVMKRRLARLTIVEAEQWLRLTLARHCVDPTLVSEQRIVEGAAEIFYCFRTADFPKAFVQTIRSTALSFLRSYLPGNGSLWQLASRITTPTVIIWGSHDQAFPVRLADKLARAIPNSQLHIVDNVGHVAHVEAPGQVAPMCISRFSRFG